ncbi:GNAT family N-acetyltransferase [Aliikangiella sp. IMCC44632]
MPQIRKISTQSIPMALLLLADPYEAKVKAYLAGAACYAAFIDNKLVSACVTNVNTHGEIELFNIATFSEWQGQGIGTQLIEFVIHDLRSRNISKLVLGTGTFGYQLTFYQRVGFRVDAVVKAFFIDHYNEPIIENGIQHFDMLRLSYKI